MSTTSGHYIQALLLAAGRGTRFDRTGRHNKLLATMKGTSDSVAEHTARTLLEVLPVLAIVREEGLLANKLRHVGCEVSVCGAIADKGMSTSLKHGILQSVHASGWLIALADMPFVSIGTIQKIVSAMVNGADIVTPSTHQKRGHPVGFSRLHLDELLHISGDQGARSLLANYPVTDVEVLDPGIWMDIDTQTELHQLAKP